MLRVRTPLATLAAALLCALGVAGTPAHAANLLPPLLTPPVLPTPPPSVAADPACADAGLTPDATNLERVERATRCLVDRERAKLHLPALRSRPVLTRAARAFAAQLVRERFFDHTAPNGRTLLDRIRATSYLKSPMRRWGVGENIAYGTGELSTPAAIVGAWMRSPGHRHNILDPGFAEAGVGVTFGTPLGPGGATFVQDFGERVR